MPLGTTTAVCTGGVYTSNRPCPSIVIAVLVTLVALVPPDTASAQSLPDGWTSVDVGSPSLPGTSTVLAPSSCAVATTSCVSFSVSGGGADIWGTADQFVYVNKPLQGDGTIVARVRDLQDTDPWAKAGLMLRESLAAGSRHASIFVTPRQGVAFQRRTQTGGASLHTAGTSSGPPRWMKLERRGALVSAYESPDGLTWIRVGSDVLTAGSVVHVGIAVTSHHASARTTAGVTDVSLTTAIADEWSFANVGTPAIPGSAETNASGMRVTGAGTDIWNTSDQFAFVYRVVAGDGDIVARIAALNATHRWAKAGVMVRGSLSSEAGYALATVTPGSGIALQGRAHDGAVAQQAHVINGTFPAWLKLERRGALVHAYSSASGTQWTPLGTVVVALDDAVHVGLAVTSHDSTQVAVADIDNVRVTERSLSGNIRPNVTLTSPVSGASYVAPATVTLTAAASDADGSIASVEFHSGTTFIGSVNSPPYTGQWTGVPAGTYLVTATAVDNRGESSVSSPISISVNPPAGNAVTLPSGWTATEIGAPALAGTTSHSNGTFSVQAAGTDVWGNADQFGFVYREISGDVDVVARVANLQSPHAWTKAGLMVRSSLLRDAAHAFVMVTGGSGIAFQGRPHPGASSQHVQGQTGGAPAWLKLQRRGSAVTAFISNDGVQWTTLGTTSIALSTSAYVGIAVTSHSASQLATAVVSDVAVSAAAAAPPANRAPAVSLTMPAVNASFTAPAGIGLAASASDADGTISRVDFYAGSTLIASDTSSPYLATWSNVSSGVYTLTAVAVDNAGTPATSPAVTVTVSPAASTPTTLIFTASSDHATLVQRYLFNVYRASDSPATSAPVASQDLGKPGMVNGEITADVGATLQSLPRGQYVVTVTAVGAAGTNASEPIPFTK